MVLCYFLNECYIQQVHTQRQLGHSLSQPGQFGQNIIVLIKGLITPAHILLLCDKTPRGKVNKTHVREGFPQTAIYDQE